MHPPADRASQQQRRRPYEEVIEATIPRYPSIYFLKEQLQLQRKEGRSAKGRAAVIEFHNLNKIKHVAFAAPAELESYLRDTRRCAKRLFLIEDVAAEYIEAIGSALVVDPRFFASHIAASDSESAIRPFIPSLHDSERSFLVRYPETLPLYLPNTDSSQVDFFVKSNARRKTRSLGMKFSGSTMATIERSLSFWSRQYDERAWDSIILTDPPVEVGGLMADGLFPGAANESRYTWGDFEDFKVGKQLKFLGMDSTEAVSWPHNVLDLDELRSIVSNRSRRESMLDNVVSNWLENANDANGPRYPVSPIDSAIFAKKIALANWTSLVEYLRCGQSKLDLTYARSGDPYDVLYLQLRAYHVFLGEVESNMQQLELTQTVNRQSSVAINNIAMPSSNEKYPGEVADWMYVHSRLSFLKTYTAELSWMINAKSTSGSRHIGYAAKDYCSKTQYWRMSFRKRFPGAITGEIPSGMTIARAVAAFILAGIMLSWKTIPEDLATSHVTLVSVLIMILVLLTALVLCFARRPIKKRLVDHAPKNFERRDSKYGSSSSKNHQLEGEYNKESNVGDRISKDDNV